MNWQDIPVGVIRHDELLNGLLAVWKARCDMIATGDKMYELGFENGLNAIAQIVGLEDLFGSQKTAYLAKRKIGYYPEKEVMLLK